MNNRFQARVFSYIAILSMLFSALGIPAQSVLAAPAGTALQFNGTNQHVTFGNTRSVPGTCLEYISQLQTGQFIVII